MGNGLLRSRRGGGRIPQPLTIPIGGVVLGHPIFGQSIYPLKHHHTRPCKRHGVGGPPIALPRIQSAPPIKVNAKDCRRLIVSSSRSRRRRRSDPLVHHAAGKGMRRAEDNGKNSPKNGNDFQRCRPLRRLCKIGSDTTAAAASLSRREVNVGTRGLVHHNSPRAEPFG